MDTSKLASAATNCPWFRVLTALARQAAPDGTAFPDRVRSQRVIMDTESLLGSARAGAVNDIRGVTIIVRCDGAMYTGWLKVSEDHSILIYPGTQGITTKAVPVSLRLSRSQWRLSSLPQALLRYADAVCSYARTGTASGADGLAVGANSLSFESGLKVPAAPIAVVGLALAALCYSQGLDLSDFASGMVEEGFNEDLVPIAHPGTGALTRTSDGAVQQAGGCGCFLLVGLLAPLVGASVAAVTHLI